MSRFIETLQRKRQKETIPAAMRLERDAKKIFQEAERARSIKKRLELTKRLVREQEAKMRSENQPQWEEAKRQFEKSGLLEIFREVIAVGGAKEVRGDSETFDSTFDSSNESKYFIQERTGRPYFFTELLIGENRVSKHGDKHEVTITRNYVATEVDRNGTVLFIGKKRLFDRRNFGSVIAKVARVTWERDQSALEIALEKTYGHQATYRFTRPV